MGTGGGRFHNHLTKSTPRADATVTSSPPEIRLWFAEKPEPALSTITLVAPDSSRVELGKVRATDDPLSVTADVRRTLRPGKYLVRWKTAGKDGHAVRGSYSFQLSP
jgi:hypothetical protein